jgi:metallo-beta-lactamase family protein
MQFMLMDAAKIEEQDADYRARHHIGAPDERIPLFTTDDIPAVIQQTVAVPYVRESKAWHEVVPGMQLKFYDAGHILGSAVTVLDWGKSTLAYTGDMGPANLPLLRDPEIPEEDIKTLIMESTYGARSHESMETALDELAKAITTVCERGGKMIMPAFSLGRTQSFVYLLHRLTDENKIPRFPIYVDSPLATNITDVYRSHWHDYDDETVQDFGEKHPPLAFRNLTYTRSVEESKALNTAQGPFMVISASGMMTAGRVVHHLRHSIADENNAIFITGYQAQGTLGRRILEGAKRVELYGNWFNVKADIFTFNEFSAHADNNQLVEYAKKLKGLQQIALVHGESAQADVLQISLQEASSDWQVQRPNEGDSIAV